MSKMQFTFTDVVTGNSKICRTIPNYQRTWDAMKEKGADLKYIRRYEMDGIVCVDIGYELK